MMCLYDMTEEYKLSVDKYQNIISIAMKPLLLSKNDGVAVGLFNFPHFQQCMAKILSYIMVII